MRLFKVQLTVCSNKILPFSGLLASAFKTATALYADPGPADPFEPVIMLPIVTDSCPPELCRQDLVKSNIGSV